MIQYLDDNDNDISYLWYSDSTPKNWRISFFKLVDGQLTPTDIYYNDNIGQESIKISESLCSQDTLMFGGCESNTVQFTLQNVVTSQGVRRAHLNQVCVVDVQVGEVGNPYFRIGTYIVKKDEPTADRSGREITAYDTLYDTLNADISDWWNNHAGWAGATPQRTIKQLRDSFCTYYGIEQETTTLVNDSIIIRKVADKDSLSGKKFLSNLCELNGCFAHMGRDNKLHYIQLDPIIEGLYPNHPIYQVGQTAQYSLFPIEENTGYENLYPREEHVGGVIEKGQYISATYEDYYVNAISKVRIWNKNGAKVGESGNGTNIYNVADNLLIDHLLTATDAQTISNNLYNEIYPIRYMACDINAVGNPCIEVGDSLRLVTKFDVVYLFVLERSLNGAQALKDDYRSNGEEFRLDDMVSRKPYTTMYKNLNSQLSAINSNFSNYYTKTQIQSSYYTKNDIDNKGYITSSALEGYATETWVTNKGYITSSALNGYATETWVGNNFYNSASDINSAFENTTFSAKAVTSNAVTSSSIVSLGGVTVAGTLKVGTHDLSFQTIVTSQGTYHVLGYGGPNP